MWPSSSPPPRSPRSARSPLQHALIVLVLRPSPDRPGQYRAAPVRPGYLPHRCLLLPDCLYGGLLLAVQVALLLQAQLHGVVLCHQLLLLGLQRDQLGLNLGVDEISDVLGMEAGYGAG